MSTGESLRTGQNHLVTDGYGQSARLIPENADCARLLMHDRLTHSAPSTPPHLFDRRNFFNANVLRPANTWHSSFAPFNKIDVGIEAAITQPTPVRKQNGIGTSPCVAPKSIRMKTLQD